MTDEKQARFKARARVDIKNLYDRGQVSSKDYAAAFRHVKFVWLDDLTDAQIDEFVREAIRELEAPAVNPAELSSVHSCSRFNPFPANAILSPDYPVIV